MTDESRVTAGAQGAARPKRSVALSVLVLVLALGVFAAAVWYVGGVDYVMGLLGAGSPAPAAPAQQAASTTATSTVGRPIAGTTTSGGLNLPAGVDEMLAKRMYVEQIESTVNLAKLANGDVTRFVINRVDATDTTATISLNAMFSDGTSAPGVMYLVKRSGSWYFLSIGGMNMTKASGLAAGVGVGGSTEIVESNLSDVTETLSGLGIKTFDTGVINSILSQQSVNQPLLKDVVGGTYTTIEMGKPLAGAGTSSVPVTLKGKSGVAQSGRLVLIKASVDGHDLTFLTTFSKQ
jgi:hypothetical protein